MATVGRSILSSTVMEFFDALRSYDAARAAKPLVADVLFDTPWSGTLHGKPAVEAFLKGWLTDAVKRPSFTIRDLSGDGAVIHLALSISGRFGKAPEHLTMSVLALRGVIHQVVVRPAAAH
ncbi:MAG: nuclear transport factor 2 family protein [Candidatus Thermoplasmatota archaeon]